MFGKFKQWLGIEGVKVDLELDESYGAASGELIGAVLLRSMHDQVVNFLKIELVEVYARGKGNEKRIDEYSLGVKIVEYPIKVSKHKSTRIPFVIPYTLKFSEIDKLAKNKFYKPFISLVKWGNNVKSIFYVKVQASVQGTKFNPVISREIKIR